MPRSKTQTPPGPKRPRVKKTGSGTATVITHGPGKKPRKTGANARVPSGRQPTRRSSADSMRQAH